MPQNNLQNFSSYQQRKQPIHFYATSRNSMQELYNGMSHNGGVSSPSKYFSSKISPINSNSSTVLNRSPQSSFNVDRVMNPSYPSKYTKIATKMQMLQKNLNRLNGQYESLKQMFQRSQEIANVHLIFTGIDQLKQRMQQSKLNKHIQQKRYEARYEVVYDEWANKFNELEQTQVTTQKNTLIELQKANNTLMQDNKNIEVYEAIHSNCSQSINDLNVNVQRYMNQVNEGIIKESRQLIKKLKVQEKITKEEKQVQLKTKQIKTKLGQLKCITEYEMFLEKEFLINKQLLKLRANFQANPKLTQKQKTQQMNLMQLKFSKDQRRFVSIQSLDRLTFQLARIDSKFVKVLQKYETQHNKNNKGQNKANSKFFSSSSKKQDKHHIGSQVELIQSDVVKLNHQLLGLKRYYNRSTQRIHRFDSDTNNQKSEKGQSQNDEFLQSINDFEGKIKLLDSNLHFFKTKCK